MLRPPAQPGRLHDLHAADAAGDECDERHERALRGSLAAGSRGVNRNILTLQEISPYDHWMTPSRITPIPALRSMTGFGRAEATGDAATVTVEARSVNHRHLDIALRLPRALSAFEMDARRMIQSRLERGRIAVAVQLGPAPGHSAQQVKADATLAAHYVAEARELGRTLGLRGDLALRGADD